MRTPGSLHESFWHQLRMRLTQPVDIAGIAVFRIVYGAVLVWEVWRYYSNGWIRAYYIDPPMHFTYPGFDWVRPWPGDWMYAHFAILGALALCIVIGFAYRLSIVLFTVGFAWWFLLEKARYQNHFYLILLLGLILCVIPAHGALSIDARLKPRLRRKTIPAWMLWLVRFQVAVPFFFGGIAKISPDWLRGEPMRMWLADCADFPFVGPHLTDEWAVWFFSYGGLLFDLLIAPLLLWKRTRAPAWVVNVLFHLTNAGLFHIGIFPWFLIGATTIFFEPDWPRRLLARATGCGAFCTSPTVADCGRPLAAGTALVLAVFVAIQCLVPFQHYLYPGPSIWTYEGEYFAWHMRLADKVSGIRFEITAPVGDRRIVHDPNSELPRWQVDAMSVNPEMIRQYAHYLAGKCYREGRGHVEVRAMVLNSLHGRQPQPLVDANVDLTEKPFSWRAARWIVPLEEPAPGDWRPSLARQ